MGLFIVSHLLLMTLLFQPTEENAEWKPSTAPEPDTQSVHLREFCLRTPDDSRWTSSASVTQQPTKSAHPTKHATQTPQQPRTEPTPEPEGDIEGSGDTIVAKNARHGLGAQVISGCRCQDKEKKLPSEAEFLNIMMWFPTETCKSAEFIGRLRDGTEVCVITPSLSAFYKEVLHNRSVPAAVPLIHEEPLIKSPAPLDPTTELPTTTQPSVTETNQVHDPNPQTVFPDIVEDTEESSGDLAHESEESVHEELQIQPEFVVQQREPCVFCSGFLSNLNPKDIQFLEMIVPSPECPVRIHVTLKNGMSFCVDSSQQWFSTMLEKLEIQDH